VIEPHKDFRLNPERAVYVQGLIDTNLLYRLTPRIVALQHESRDPITVYIDSPGGSVEHMFALLRLLRSQNQDSEAACRLITVATSQAASAAADLLTYGNYALAYPNSTILFHGIRFTTQQAITAEHSSLYAEVLRRNNENSAAELSREIEFRFMFRFITSRPSFDEIRNSEGAPDMSDLDCFLHLISWNVSDDANQLLDSSKDRHSRYVDLVTTVGLRTAALKGDSPVEIEAAQIKAIVDFELEQNRGDAGFTFESWGLSKLTDDFLLLHEYQLLSESDRFKRFCSLYGAFLVTDEEAQGIQSCGTDEEKEEAWAERVSPILQPVWSFFVALCNALQRGENKLTASDAYWLGLIDEVISRSDLRPFRLIREYKPDPKPVTGADSAALKQSSKGKRSAKKA
jgi:ATP-dependent protease ClpP protease subunit